MNFKKQVFHGPNTYAGFAGVLIEFEAPFHTRLSVDAIDKHWRKMSGIEGSLLVDETLDREVSFVDLCTMIVSYLYQPTAFKNQEFIAHGYEENSARSWVIVRYIYVAAASQVLRLALDLASVIFSSIIEGDSNIDRLRPDHIAEIRKRIDRLSPSKKSQLLMNAALSRGVPVYSTSPGSEVWQYGQGILGRHNFFGANEHDSVTGERLCHNKVHASEFIKKLGFPSVVHGAANSVDSAVRIAAQIGYPVVVKPINGARGDGVTAAIDSQSELVNAFKLAMRQSARGVVVERHVNGTHHRLAVFGGKLVWVMILYPARVIGDGVHSVAGLIEQENQCRQRDDKNKPILMDAAMEGLLAKKGLSYDYCPAQGEEIQLRSVSNHSQGGTIEYFAEQIHPEIREMAETLARAFRMNAMGIDFITEDIAQSWRDVPCAIIEVNQTPGFTTLKDAEIVLMRMFPPDSNGRIPSVLLIDASPEISKLVAAGMSSAGLSVGQANPSSTLLNEHKRGKSTDTLQDRVNSLIADPLCQAIVVGSSADDISRYGLPLDRFDLALIPGTMSSDLVRLIDAHCRQVELYEGEHNFDATIETSLEHLISSYHSILDVT